MSSLQSGRTASRFSPHELQFYRKQFEMFDANHDGVISVLELTHVSRELGYRFTGEQLKVGASNVIIKIRFVDIQRITLYTWGFCRR